MSGYLKTEICTTAIGDYLSCETTFAWLQGWSPIAGYTVQLFIILLKIYYELRFPFEMHY
jgi:hypothetical protein